MHSVAENNRNHFPHMQCICPYCKSKNCKDTKFKNLAINGILEPSTNNVLLLFESCCKSIFFLSFYSQLIQCKPKQHRRNYLILRKKYIKQKEKASRYMMDGNLPTKFGDTSVTISTKKNLLLAPTDPKCLRNVAQL